jgi:transcriptional regulator with XRE-family HTH domain
MLVSDLQNSLRRTTLKRIANREISGVTLARATGFEQAHVSNFLHGHRNLSIEGFDKFLKALDLSVKDLFFSSKRVASGAKRPKVGHSKAKSKRQM